MREHRSFLAGLLLGMSVLLSCGGITQNVELLRAQRIQLVDNDDRVTLDVGATLKQLEKRLATLEAKRPTR